MTRRCPKVVVLGLLFTFAITIKCQSQTSTSYDTSKPWCYWWWMGSAVDEQNISYQLDAFAEAGFGGVHIIPIYGAKGYENNFIPYLSKRWIDMLSYTLDKAERLGLGVDMTMGTGWPFGGPSVGVKDAAARYELRDGKFELKHTKQKVKRAAPGGEGLVLDHFDQHAVSRYLKGFDAPLSESRQRLRALYNDSYEVYGANFTKDFLHAFKQKRGYALEDHVAEFTDTTSAAGTLIRVDYHQTLSELLHDQFAANWTGWAKTHSLMTRYQAHGSPGNLIDLYALADIPETESFGTSMFSIPNLRIDEHYEQDRFGKPDPMAMKFASSAANLTGKQLVSSETGTWLSDHFKVSLSQVNLRLMSYLLPVSIMYFITV